MQIKLSAEHAGRHTSGHPTGGPAAGHVAGPAAGHVADGAAAARKARFGALPERVSYDAMVEERQAAPRNPERDAYDPEGSWMSFSCLAADLGL